ncbi:MAG: ATP-binding protein [Nitrospirota bacterium]
MPFNALSETDFTNRNSELSFLGRVAELSTEGFASNVVVEGARGIGKTELLKQFHRSLFWKTDHVVPFYYGFQRAALGGENFARDYLSRFVRQFIAYLKQDPSLALNRVVPLRRLMPLYSSAGHGWMIEIVEDLEEQMRSGDVHSLLLGAISVPVVSAARSGMPVMVLLDDFHLAAWLYRDRPGDTRGMVSLFEDAINSALCPHVLTGSPEGALESILSDDALRGKTGKMTLSSLPEDEAFAFFRSFGARLGLTVGDDCLKFMGLLGGNPLYIKNLARCLWRQNRLKVSDEDFWECYGYDVTSGDTSLYWSSVLGGFLANAKQRSIALELLMHLLETAGNVRRVDRLSMELGVREAELQEVVRALEKGGMLRATGGLRLPADPVLEDFIRASYLRETKGYDNEKARSLIRSQRRTVGGDSESFEIVIPMTQDAELVAARAVEQLCSRINLKPDLVSQFQLAIIEACLNAMEHSGSYDKKVRLKFSINRERVEISIESPGKAFAPEGVGFPTVEEKLASGDKRGWGLRLMRELMDEVRFYPTDEGTKVVLVKKITPNEVTEK